MDFKNVDKKYRPIPFWSWNEKLDTEETKRQIRIMDEAGIGGYFMHARGGLLTEYMGEEWFDNVKASIEEGDKRGMHSWVKTRDLTEFRYRRSYSPGPPSLNTKETSRCTTQKVLTKPEPPPYHNGSIGKRPYTTKI